MLAPTGLQIPSLDSCCEDYLFAIGFSSESFAR